MEKLISVIVPVYNVEKYIHRCIDSILTQTYTNLEIILVDDGSTDNSGKICDKYAQKDNRIKVIHQENQGLSMARNIGLDNCSGDYIAFVDSDDYIHPRIYELLYEALTENDADMAFCDYKRIVNEDLEYKKIEDYKFNIYSRNEALNRICTDNARIIVAWNKLYKREIFKKLRYPKGVVCEDAHIVLDVVLSCNKIVYVEEELYCYSIERDDSIMRMKYNLKMMKDELTAYSKIINYFDNNKLPELYTGYCWAFFRYIERIRYHYKKVRECFSDRKDILYKLLLEYIKRYTLKARRMIMKPSVRHNYDLFYIKCKFLKLKYLNKELKRIYRKELRKNLIKKIEKLEKKRIFLLGTPEYGNLGDHAIAIASKKFLEDNFKDYDIIEITSSDFYFGNIEIKNVIKKDDIILITGGGFLGSLWVNPFGEEMVRDILKSFPENKVVILPQTIYFEDSKYGREQFEISKKIYEKHENLVICIREQNSFNFMQQNMPDVKVKLIPDMVLYNKFEFKHKKRKDAIICLRNDKEKKQSNEKIIEDIYKKYNKVKFLDTAINKSIIPKNREKYVKRILNNFAGAKLIVTDRLHGMLFAYITGTEHIFLDNLSKKVSGVYETWLNKQEDKVVLDKYWQELINTIKGE